MMAKKLNHCQACWSLYLARFNFLLHHCPKHTMGKPDTLSRRADYGNGASDNENIVLLRLESLAVCALEGVQLTGKKQRILSDICKENCNGDQEESIAKVARELWGSANEVVYSSEWSNIDGLLWFREKIYVLWNPNLCRQIIALCHDTPITGHPGCWKILELVSQNYWWPRCLGTSASMWVSVISVSRRIVGHTQCQFRGRTSGVLWTWHCYDCRRFCLQKSALCSDVTLLENFLQKCSIGYTLYPWISLLKSTLETSYKPQT